MSCYIRFCHTGGHQCNDQVNWLPPFEYIVLANTYNYREGCGLVVMTGDWRDFVGCGCLGSSIWRQVLQQKREPAGQVLASREEVGI